MKKYFCLAVMISFLFVAVPVLAYNPRIVSPDVFETPIINPEISQAFYGELIGAQQVFRINSDKPFKLEVNILVPDLPGIGKDKTVEVVTVKENGQGERLFLIGGRKAEWKKYHGESAGDDYWQGPTEKREVGAGQYIIRVSSPNYLGKYCLVIGGQEKFSPSEIINTIKILPQIKKDFFLQPVWSAFFNRIGLLIFGPVALIIVVIILSFVAYKKRQYLIDKFKSK